MTLETTPEGIFLLPSLIYLSQECRKMPASSHIFKIFFYFVCFCGVNIYQAKVIWNFVLAHLILSTDFMNRRYY